MYVFHYDPNTMAYVGNSPVDFCQLQPGTALVPAWATQVPPPGGWDSRIEMPYYVLEKDAWEVRRLPPPPATPVPPSDAEVLDRMQELKRTLEAHLRSAGEIIEQIEAAKAG